MLEAYIGLSVAIIVVLFWGARDVRGFLRDHPAIRSQEDFAALKRLARRNMIAALVCLASLPVWAILAIAISHEQHLHLKILTWSVVIPAGLITKRNKALEDAARGLPCDARFADEYRRIGEAWKHKALPDF